MPRRAWLALSALVLLALASWWLGRPGEERGTAPGHTAGERPDYYFEDATVTQLDENGKPAYRLRAARMDHYPSDDSVKMSSVHIDYFRPDAPAWVITADHGMIPSGNRRMRLDGNVHLLRPSASAGEPPLEANTPSLELLSDPRSARTDQPVTVVNGGSTVRGVGMLADLSAGTLTLQNQVKGHYEH
ncbi:MAG: LPS export ABC transporter periplasmic protein LptC [Gammaproteobacteria bacterium]|jgi:lipopolysaccharide export system protein LptC